MACRTRHELDERKLAAASDPGKSAEQDNGKDENHSDESGDYRLGHTKNIGEQPEGDAKPHDGPGDCRFYCTPQLRRLHWTNVMSCELSLANSAERKSLKFL